MFAKLNLPVVCLLKNLLLDKTKGGGFSQPRPSLRSCFVSCRLVLHDLLHHVLDDCSVAVACHVCVVAVAIVADDDNQLVVLVILQMVNPRDCCADGVAQQSLDKLLALHCGSFLSLALPRH